MDWNPSRKRNDMMTYTYYIFYLKSDKSIYAYTTSKEDRDIFYLTRDMSKFKLRKEKLQKDDVSYLTKNHRHNIIMNYKFKIYKDGDDIILPITEMERMDIERKGYQITFVDIFAKVMNVPSEIFNDEVLEILNDIYYTYIEYIMDSNQRLQECIFEPNLFNIFIQDHFWSLDLSNLNELYKEKCLRKESKKR